MIAKALLVAALAAAVLAQIPTAPVETVWEGMYAPPYLTNPQIALAMDCSSASECYLAGGSNGVGFGIFKYDGKMDGLVTKMMEPNMSMIAMDLAVGNNNGVPTGAFSSITEFGISKALQYLSNKGTEWLPSAMPLELIWAGQSISGNPTGSQLVAVGSGISGNNLMISNDFGASFSAQKITYNDDPTGCSYPGYIDIVSPNAWFMTFGAEPPANNSNNQYFSAATEEIVGRKANGQVLVIRHKQTGKVRQHTKSLLELRRDRHADLAAAKDQKCNFYKGEILKSTDQGKTWTKQFEMPNALTSYVKCYDATHCAVTAFNPDDSYTIVTTDGTNWKVTYTAPPASQSSATNIAALAYASQTELWAGGSQESQAGGKGLFWSSKDAGQTWTAYPHYVPDVMAMMAVDFADGVGFALGLTMFKTAQIMRYKKQPDYGNFVQAHCPIAGCSILCQNLTFPQGMCMEAQGGSVKAFCSTEGVKQYMYDTTSCVGSYKVAVQPINQCLNGTNTFFENYCPPPQEHSNARAATSKDIFQH